MVESFSDRNLILVKLGGSIISDKKVPYSIKEDTISRLSEEIALARQEVGKESLFIIGNGGGSFSHPLAAKYQVEKGFVNKESLKGFSLTAGAEIRMNRIVMDHLVKVDLPVISFAPLSFLLAKNHELTKFFLDPIKKALFEGMIPAVYGDMIVDETMGCMAVSTEKVLNLLASKLQSKFKNVKIILCGITNGVYDNEGKTIPEINKKVFVIVEKFISGSEGVDVTGGMLTKVTESLSLAKKYGISTLIINGNKKDNLFKTILGEEINDSTCIK